MAQQMLTAMEAKPTAATDKQHATPKNKAKGRRKGKSRTSYSLSHKLRAVEEAERSGLKAAAVSLQLDEQLLRTWLLKAEDLRQAGLTNAGTSRRLRSGSKGAKLLANSPPDDDDDEVKLQSVHAFLLLLFVVELFVCCLEKKKRERINQSCYFFFTVLD